MEEILASIRRIISEDDAPAEPAAEEAPVVEPEPLLEPEPDFGGDGEDVNEIQELQDTTLPERRDAAPWTFTAALYPGARQAGSTPAAMRPIRYSVSACGLLR